MNLSKKFKRQTTDQDDDIIIIESVCSESRNEICQHVDQTTGEHCPDYYSVLCIHCQLHLCFIHLELHRLLLINERDRLSDQFNERVDHLCQWRAHPIQCQAFLLENYQVKFKRKLSFVQRLALEKSINLARIIDELQILLQSVRVLFCQQQSVSSFQLERMRECLGQYDRKRLLFLTQIVDSLPVEQSSSVNLFCLAKIATPCRQFPLSVQRSSSSEMAASEDLLLINDRDHLLLFDFSDTFDESSIPEMIEWKHHRDGKILDLHYNPHQKFFLLLTEEKLFAFQRPSTFVCLSRLTSLAWSCTTMDHSIYLLYKHSISIEQWTLDTNLSSIQMSQQWKSNEIIPDSEHDQHLRCIRTNPSQNQLAILIEDDECRWRIAVFDRNMHCLHQTGTLHDASTFDWNLVFSYVTDQQILVMDATTENSYLIAIGENISSIEYQSFSHVDCPVNACTVTKNGFSQLILKTVRPNQLRFCQI